MTFIKKLNNLYPQTLNRWRIIIIISLFISFFMIIFQPFGLHNIQHVHKGMILAGYGFITFIMLVLNLIFLPLIFPNVFNEDSWTIKKEIVWLLWIVITISVGNYLYSIIFSIFLWIGLKGFFLFIVFTLLIAVIPIAGITFITQNVFLKRNLSASRDINSLIGQKEVNRRNNNEFFSTTSGSQNFSVKIEDLIFIESEGNYVNIWYLKDAKVKSILIRNTLKNIELQIENSVLFKCHRAFIINPSFVEKVKGNSQGYNIVIKNTDKELPVARSYTKTFKKEITKLI